MRSLFPLWLAVVPPAFFSCGARTELDVIDAGCAPETCASGLEWDTRSCSCVPQHCAPQPCASGLHWDTATCSCAPMACPNDAGETTIASISTDFAEGTAITTFGGDVYFATRAGKTDSLGTVSKVSRCGGMVTTLAQGLQGPTSVVTDGVHVFFGTLGGGQPPVQGALQMVSTSGGVPSTIATGAIYQGALTTDSQDLYWTSEAGGSGVWRMPLAGGAPTPIGPDQVFNYVAVDASRAFLSQPASIPANSRILSMPIGGGPLKELVSSDVVFPGVLVIDDTSIYCVTGDSNLVKLPKDGGATTMLAHAEINDMAVDDANVYWAQGDATTGTPDAIKRVPKTGGPATQISTSYGHRIALDDTYVYWLKGGDVLRLPK